MIAVALKGLAGRKLRALLTAFAIVIGVAMVSGTFILTDTMQKSFDGAFGALYDDTDAVIQGKQLVKSSISGSVTIPESLLTEVRELPEVDSAAGMVWPPDPNAAAIIGRSGKAVARESIGTSVDAAHPEFSPLKLKQGDWAKGADQVVIDAGSASKQHLTVGDPVEIRTQGRTRSYRVTGIASFGDIDSLGFGSVAAWDVKTAQRVLGRSRQFDRISIAAAAGTRPADLLRAVRAVVADPLEVQDSATQAREASEQIDKGLAGIRYFLLGFGFIALFVGAFVIFNTLSITVAQRTREIATLRTLGASRKQVLRSVRLEGLAIGVVASLIGLFLGFGIAQGMLALFSMLGLDLPETSMVFARRTATVSILLGTGITLLATVAPARRATRVPPIAAVREGSTLPSSRLGAHSLYAGSGTVLASVAALGAALLAPGLSGLAVGLLIGLGLLGLFGGIAMLAPRLVRPLAHVVGWPARRIGGVAGELADANSRRHPGRTASTAAALMIGLTLVTVVAMLGAGLRVSTKQAVSDQLHADYVVDSKNDLPFNPAGGDKLAAVDGVRAASHVRSDQAIVQEGERAITGIDPATIADFYRFTWSRGSENALARLGDDGALVTADFAKDEHLRVGDRLSVTTPTGEKPRVTVRGIYEAPKSNPLLGNVSITQATFDDAFPNPKNSFTFLAADRGARAALESTARGLGDAALHTGAAYPQHATKDISTFLAMLYVLLAFSVIVSLFGMVNTMVLSVFERTRELGMLRAIGMTRRQTRRMIRHESVITALIGAALGLGLGVFVAALLSQALPSDEIALSLPITELVAFTAVAVLAGIAAAVLPARHAARLNVLDALHYE